MTPLARKLTDLGQAADLSDQDLIEAIRWFAVRGIGFTVETAYDSDGDITGYGIGPGRTAIAPQGPAPTASATEGERHTVADQQDGVTLGYARSKGLYHIDEIRGYSPVAIYQRSMGGPDQVEGDSSAVVQVETVTVHVGDWLTEREAEALAGQTHLTVRPYRLDA